MADYGPARSEAEWSRRAVLWTYLSELYLDTAVTEEAIGAIAQTARVLNAGPDDIRAMLIYEVGPACAHNLLVLAPLGLADWVPFDQDGLVRRIRRNWHRPLHRWRSRRRAGDALGVIEPSLRRLWQAMEERP